MFAPCCWVYVARNAAWACCRACSLAVAFSIFFDSSCCRSPSWVSRSSRFSYAFWSLPDR